MDVRWIIDGCSLDSRLMFVGSRDGWSLDSRWMFVGASMDVRWNLDGCSLDSRWVFVGFAMDLRWILDGCASRTRLGEHGTLTQCVGYSPPKKYLRN